MLNRDVVLVMCALSIGCAMGCSDQPGTAPGAVAASGSGGAGGAGGAAGVGGNTAGAGGTSAGGTSGTGGTSGADPSDSGVTGGGPAPDAMITSDGGDAPRGSGPGDWIAGDYPPGLMSADYLEISGVPGQGDYVRQYKVHVPPSYDPDVPMPLVFCIHGLGQDPILFCLNGAAMPAKSDEAGFILVMPVGYGNSWNAGTCCGAASDEQLDDVALFRAIFEEVTTHLNVDLDRVYATGLSNGGYMSYRLACEAADIFTAVAPVAGAIGINDIGGGTNGASNFTSCTPSRPVSILDTHGTADGLVAYALQAPTLELAAKNNGCGTTTKPAEAPPSAGDTTCVAYEGCPSGIELIACTIEGGGHCWFGSPDCGTGAGDFGAAIVGANSDTMDNTEANWEFLERQAR